MDNGPTSFEIPDTYFAPAGRDTADEFARKQAIIRNNPLLMESLNAIPGMVMILNAHRQIVAANPGLFSSRTWRAELP